TARAGTRYGGLTIRAQRTRWASCSSKGAMSFNWRLLLAPPEILDYVVEHEVCHLDVMDHSPRFWRLLAARVPAWRAHAAWLRRPGRASASATVPRPSPSTRGPQRIMTRHATSADLAQQRLDRRPARDLAAVDAREARVDGRTAQRAGDRGRLRATVDHRAG